MTLSDRSTARVDSLDGLRGVAAAMVVLYHLQLSAPTVRLPNPANPSVSTVGWILGYSPLRIIWAGGEAVWIFFVLSGFVLVRPYLAGRRLSTGRFYIRRALRLYFPFLGSVAFAWILHRAVDHHFEVGQDPFLFFHAFPVRMGDVAATSTLMLKNTTPLNSVWWSLRWEVVFSLAIPVIVLAIRSRWMRGRWMWLLAACLAVIAVAPRPVERWGWFQAGNDNPLVNLPMFGVGVAIAMGETTIRARFDRMRTWQLVSVGIGGWVALACAVDVNTVLAHHGVSPSTTWLVVGPVGVIGAAIVVSLVLSVRRLDRVFSTGPVHWLGRRSYTLYLIHEPIIVAVGFALVLKHGTWWSVSMTLTLVLVATAIFYALVEKPSLRLVARIPPTRRRREYPFDTSSPPPSE